MEIEHRLIVNSFEGDGSVKKPDPRVPSAAPPTTNTSNNTSGVYTKSFFNRNRLQNNMNNNGNNIPAILSNPPHPRSFSSNQFFSPSALMPYPGMGHPGFENLGYYNPMFNSLNPQVAAAAAAAAQAGPLNGRYNPISAPLGDLRGYSGYGAYYPPGSAGMMKSPSSGDTINSGYSIQSSRSDASSRTSNGTGEQTTGNKADLQYYYDPNYSSYLPRLAVAGQGGHLGMMGMNPYASMMSTGYSAPGNNGYDSYTGNKHQHQSQQQQQQQQQKFPLHPGTNYNGGGIGHVVHRNGFTK